MAFSAMFSGFNLLTLIFWFVVIDGKQFRFDYDYYPEADGWMKLHLIPAKWEDARLRCFREGAVLASPEDENIWAAMKRTIKNAHIPKARGIYTGTHATYAKGYYQSIEGTPLARMPVRWAPDEPDNADDAEDCLMMLTNGTFADVACSRVFPFVCYRKKTSDLTVTNCGTVDREYYLEPRTGSCYKFHTYPQTWPRAYAACSAEGGHLAIVNSNTEAQALKELIDKHPEENMTGSFTKYIVHMGHTDWGTRGLWMTVHGQTLIEAGYNNWPKGQPDNATTGQFCGSMFRSTQLDDGWCHTPCTFICEKKPDSLLTDGEIY